MPNESVSIVVNRNSLLALARPLPRGQCRFARGIRARFVSSSYATRRENYSRKNSIICTAIPMPGTCSCPNGRICSINRTTRRTTAHSTIRIFAISSSTMSPVSRHCLSERHSVIRLPGLAANETTTTTVSQRYKTQQLLSITLIGIVGARYGQEVEPTRQSNTPIHGFTVESPEMILKLSKAFPMRSNACRRCPPLGLQVEF